MPRYALLHMSDGALRYLIVVCIRRGTIQVRVTLPEHLNSPPDSQRVVEDANQVNRALGGGGGRTVRCIRQR